MYQFGIVLGSQVTKGLRSMDTVRLSIHKTLDRLPQGVMLTDANGGLAAASHS